MDLEELRKLSQEAGNDKEKQILKICDPQKIAKDLKSELEIAAKNSAKAGKREASASFLIWRIYRDPSNREFDKRDGPLVESRDDELAQVLFNMVQRYITDSTIKLSLRTFKEPGYDWKVLDAKVSW